MRIALLKPRGAALALAACLAANLVSTATADLKVGDLLPDLTAFKLEGKLPDSLKNKRVLVLDMALLLAGAKFRGEFEERLKSVLKEVAQDRVHLPSSDQPLPWCPEVQLGQSLHRLF